MIRVDELLASRVGRVENWTWPDPRKVERRTAHLIEVNRGRRQVRRSYLEGTR